MSDFDSFIFTHIPKCGGSSFRQLLNDVALKSGYSKSEIYIPTMNGRKARRNYDQLNSIQRYVWSKRRYAILGMHCGYGIHRLMPNSRSPYYFTILRHPVQRFLSHYYHFMFRQGNRGLMGVHLDDLREDDLIKICKKVSNLQTRVLCGENIGIANSKQATRQSLSAAKNILANEYGSYGFVDRLEADILQIHFTGLDFQQYAHHMEAKNISTIEYPAFHDLAQATQQIILDHHELDLELYDFAR